MIKWKRDRNRNLRKKWCICCNHKPMASDDEKTVWKLKTMRSPIPYKYLRRKKYVTPEIPEGHPSEPRHSLKKRLCIVPWINIYELLPVLCPASNANCMQRRFRANVLLMTNQNIGHWGDTVWWFVTVVTSKIFHEFSWKRKTLTVIAIRHKFFIARPGCEYQSDLFTLK